MEAEYLTGPVPGAIMLVVLIVAVVIVYLRVSNVRKAVDEAREDVKRDVRETKDEIKRKLDGQ